MADLAVWQKKIQDRRKQTPFREFLREIASRFPLMFYKNENGIGRYKMGERITPHVVPFHTYYEKSQGNVNIPYNQGGSYFESFASLLRTVTLPYFQNSVENENSLYADIAFSAKNCYLSSVAIVAENVMYSFQIKNAVDIYNSVFIQKESTNVYQSIGVLFSSNVFYCSHIQNSSNMWFCSGCTGCHDCIGCSDLMNTSYCIENKQYSQAEYEDLSRAILSDRTAYESLYNKMRVVASKIQFNNHCDSLENGSYNTSVSKGRNVIFVGDSGRCEDVYDVFSAGMNAVDFYGVAGAGYNSSHAYCCTEVTIGCHNVYYSYFLENCKNCLFCTGLVGQEYCIFNQQYTKEERYKRANEIFLQMEQDGTLGNFLPPTANPFYFNDTAACLVDGSFTQDEVAGLGYLWRDEPIKADIPDWMETVKATELNQYEGYKEGVRMIDPAILKKVIVDEEGNSYRVVKLEYDFLVKHGLPLPRKHWLERMKDNFRL